MPFSFSSRHCVYFSHPHDSPTVPANAPATSAAVARFSSEGTRSPTLSSSTAYSAADCVAPPACGSGPRAAYTHTPPLCPLQLPLPPVQPVALAPSQLALARLQLVSREVEQPRPEGAGVVPQFQDHAHEGIVLRAPL